ncbi:MAG: hypothetical protein JWN70_5321 [Planctomycetaceae bacterium]|nr:hypothetical protein [Planctomycetaceae bacterium]
MAKLDFRRRFLAGLPAIPAELGLRLDEFVQFDTSTVHLLDSEDATLLLAQGLPHDASPFLSFEAYSSEQLDSRFETFGVSKSYFPIGHNGSGDVLAIDLNTREVVYFNHDLEDARVFVNSSLIQFLECLCIFQEHLTQETMASCLADIATSDHKATAPGALWHNEVGNEVLDE